MDNDDQQQLPEWLRDVRISKSPHVNAALRCLCNIPSPPSGGRMRRECILHRAESGMDLAESTGARKGSCITDMLLSLQRHKRLERAVNLMDADMVRLQTRIRLRHSRIIRARVARSLFVIAGAILCIAIWQSDLWPTP